MPSDAQTYLVAHGLKQQRTGLRRKSAHALFNNSTEALLRAGVIDKLGALQFPFSNKPTALWARVKMPLSRPDAISWDARQKVVNAIASDESPDTLFRIWKLKRPSAVISITGGANTLEIPQFLEQDLRKGLCEAVRVTSAWVITGGTDSGVMRFTGRALKDQNCVLIGTAPWGKILGHRNLGAATGCEISDYHPSESVGAGFLGPCPPSDHTRLEPNHTHFLLVDKDGESEWGDEIVLRDALEECVASIGSDEQTPVTKVMVCLGGGIGTCTTIMHALTQNRPIVLVPESGGAARDIYEQCCLKIDPSCTEKTSQSEQYRKLLAVIEKSAANHLTFYRSDGTTPDFKEVILSACLTDSALRHRETDPIRLAVAWGDADIVRRELEAFEAPPDDERAHAGVARAFDESLRLADPDVVRTLIEFKADPSKVCFDKLLPSRLAGDLSELNQETSTVAQLVTATVNETVSSAKAAFAGTEPSRSRGATECSTSAESDEAARASDEYAMWSALDRFGFLRQFVEEDAQQAKSRVAMLIKGALVTHAKRGDGEVIEVCPDGSRIVKFAAGGKSTSSTRPVDPAATEQTHRYRPSSLHKLQPKEVDPNSLGFQLLASRFENYTSYIDWRRMRRDTAVVDDQKVHSIA